MTARDDDFLDELTRIATEHGFRRASADELSSPMQHYGCGGVIERATPGFLTGRGSCLTCGMAGRFEAITDADGGLCIEQFEVICDPPLVLDSGEEVNSFIEYGSILAVFTTELPMQ